MRILYVVSLYPCWSETFIVREINTLKRRGHTVYIASLKLDCEDFAHPEALQNIDNVLYPTRLAKQVGAFLRLLMTRPTPLCRLVIQCLTKFWSQPALLAKSLATLIRTASILPQVEDQGIEHIHAHWATYPSTASLLIADILRIPFSFTCHAHDIFLEDHLIQYKIQRSKFTATISEYNKQLLQANFHADPRKIHIVHCGIDPSQFPMIAPQGRGSKLLAVGRFDEIKGFRYLVEAVSKLRQTIPDIQCEIIGALSSGDLSKNLQDQIKSLAVTENVKLLGAQEQSVVLGKMKTCGVFVLPCVVASDGNMDGIPVVLMEAMALGTPVVSTTVSGVPELIEDQVNGYLVPPKDSGALASAISSALNDQDAQLKASAARQKIVESFNIDHETSKLERLMA